MSAHALVLSCSLAVLWLWEECAGRRAVSDDAFQSAGCRFRAEFAVFAVFAVFSVWMLWPEPSNQYVHNFAAQPLFIVRNVFRLLTTGCNRFGSAASGKSRCFVHRHYVFSHSLRLSGSAFPALFLGSAVSLYIVYVYRSV